MNAIREHRDGRFLLGAACVAVILHILVFLIPLPEAEGWTPPEEERPSRPHVDIRITPPPIKPPPEKPPIKPPERLVPVPLPARMEIDPVDVPYVETDIPPLDVEIDPFISDSPPAPPPTRDPDLPYLQHTEGLELPTPIVKDPPAYPSLARATRQSGEVILSAVIDRSGRVVEIEVVLGVAPVELGGRGFHRIAGLGHALTAGDRLPIAEGSALSPLRLQSQAKTSQHIRVMPGPQTSLFSADVRAEFEATLFHRSARANRQGVRMDHAGAPFSTDGQLNQVSDFISEGDIQMTGDGTPFVLLADCQTIGGYPRIGTVLPVDLPRIAQAEAGSELRFRFVTMEDAETAWESDDAQLERLTRQTQPRIRDPREMADLLRYEMIDRPPGDVVGD